MRHAVAEAQRRVRKYSLTKKRLRPDSEGDVNVVERCVRKYSLTKKRLRLGLVARKRTKGSLCPEVFADEEAIETQPVRPLSKAI